MQSVNWRPGLLLIKHTGVLHTGTKNRSARSRSQIRIHVISCELSKACMRSCQIWIKAWCCPCGGKVTYWEAARSAIRIGSGCRGPCGALHYYSPFAFLGIVLQCPQTSNLCAYACGCMHLHVYTNIFYLRVHFQGRCKKLRAVLPWHLTIEL